MTRRAIMFAIGGVAIAALAAGAAWAQSGAQNASSGTQNTPFNYEIKDGKRVPKPTSKVTNADGSWREETRQGNCITIKTGTADGAVKTTRKCD
ncbi:MAG TPA: hypothetical protein VJ763_09475 [Sphingomicrobium sp.]|jgi:hypothetical protein|nr:hypothetical protein [Sphingomicrobium sp.]